MSIDVVSLEFKEKMRGFYSAKKFDLSPQDPWGREAFDQELARYDKLPFEFDIKVQVPDLAAFHADHSLPSKVTGTITDFRFGDPVTIQEGYFQLFTKPSASPSFDTYKEMHYTLFLTDRESRKWTFFGFKDLRKEDSGAVWSQTTTLNFYIWEGHTFFEKFGQKKVHGVGTLRIAAKDFLQQLGSFTTNASSASRDKAEILKYFKAFLGDVWEVYAPFVFTTTASKAHEPLFPPHTTQGVRQGSVHLYPLDTQDGLSISLQRFVTDPGKDVVLLLHGLTTSTDMFIMPEHENLVNHLHNQSLTDIWSLDWRGSGRFNYNLAPHHHTIDDVAKYDIPAALDLIRAHCGSDVRIHVIAHCVGALAFMASFAAGWTRNIASIICNSVSLHPQVPWQARTKMAMGPELFESVLNYPYVSPLMPYMPGKGFGKWIYWMERSLRSECKEPACHMLSFMWGWGFPAVFNHRNIHPVTHRRLMDLFGGTSFSYHKHIRKMLKAGASTSADGRLNYFTSAIQREFPPTLLLSGAENRIFPGANKKTFEALKQSLPNADIRYLEIPFYGHQDIFMGQYCEDEVFPHIVAFLRQQAAPRTERSTPHLRVA